MGCNTTSTDKVTSSLKGIGKVGQEASRCLWQAITVTKRVHTTELPPPILSRTPIRAHAVPCPPLSVDGLHWGWRAPGAAAESNRERQQSEGIWRLPYLREAQMLFNILYIILINSWGTLRLIQSPRGRTSWKKGNNKKNLSGDNKWIITSTLSFGKTKYLETRDLFSSFF